MVKQVEYQFKAIIEIIGVNPFVFVPNNILQSIFKQAGKSKGYIPIRGAVNNNPYKQTLVKYNGEWRLYINTTMLKDSPKHIGEIVVISVTFDPESRVIKTPERFLMALAENAVAQNVFNQLSPSRRLEIVRYLAHLKSVDTLEKNITRAINFLLGNERFVGRDKP